MRPNRAMIVGALLVASGCRRSWHPEPFDPDKVPASMAAEDDASSGASPPGTKPEPSPQRRRRMAEMQRHFEVVATLEDEVIAGDLPGLHDLAAGFAAAHRNAEHPPQWEPYVTHMIEAAQRAAQTEDIDAAADAVAALAGTCGDCHRALGVGPPSPKIPEIDQGPGRGAAMRRHAWSVDRMWEGIVLPSEAHWIRGTAMFTFPPGCDRGDGHSTPTPNETLCRRVEGLGQKAHIAPSWDARIELYGRLLATCAHCHETR